jgi:AAA ATPase-like protein
MEAEQDVGWEENPPIQAPSPTFIGREEILASLQRHLLKGQHVALFGDRGIGKTAIVEEVVRWLREEKPGLRFIHVADEMTFKNLLVAVAKGLHELGLFRHPLIGPDEIADLEWRQISKRTRSLTLHELGSAVVTSLRGEGVVLILDSVNHLKPTDQAWLEEIVRNAVCVLATRDKDEKNLKPLLARFELIEVPPLSRREAQALIDALTAEHPVPSVDPKHYGKAVYDASRGYPNAIKDLIWKGSLEKYVDKDHIRGLAHDAGVRGFSIAPIILVLMAAFAVWRYVGRGVGDQDGLIIGGIGSAVSSVTVLTIKVKDLADLVVSPGAMLEKGKPLVRDQEAARQLEAIKAEIAGEKEQWEHQQAIAGEDLRTAREKVTLQEQAVHRLTEKRDTYTRQGTAGLFGRELQQLASKIAAEEAKLKDLQGDVAQEEKRQKVDAVQHREKLRALTDRAKKLESEAVVLANVSGKVISMEAEHGAEQITVKLAVATVKTELEKGARGGSTE